MRDNCRRLLAKALAGKDGTDGRLGGSHRWMHDNTLQASPSPLPPPHPISPSQASADPGTVAVALEEVIFEECWDDRVDDPEAARRAAIEYQRSNAKKQDKKQKLVSTYQNRIRCDVGRGFSFSTHPPLPLIPPLTPFAAHAHRISGRTTICAWACSAAPSPCSALPS